MIHDIFSNIVDQFCLPCSQEFLNTIGWFCFIFILVIQRLYQGYFVRISMVDSYLLNVVLFIKYGNATIIRQGWHKQPCDLCQGNLLVKGRHDEITDLLKYMLSFLRLFALANISKS